jgi:hypothetical protein
MKKQTLWIYVLFFGSIWGILEATLGYGLQFLPELVSGSIMFPIGAAIMIFAYKHTGSRKAIVYVALIAASIKAVNFLLPGLMPIKTYNPMIAIMLQGFAMVTVIALFNQKSLVAKVSSFLIASILWRVLFLVNIYINNALTGFNFRQLSSTVAMTEFVVPYGLMGALFLTVIYFGLSKINQNMSLNFKLNPAIAYSIAAVALLLTYFL